MTKVNIVGLSPGAPRSGRSSRRSDGEPDGRNHPARQFV